MATSPNTSTSTSTNSNVIKMDPLKGVKFGVGVALGLLISLAIGAAAMYFLATKYLLTKPAVAQVEVPPVAAPVFISLEPFTVNLHAGSQGRFLHVGLTLKVKDAKAQTQIIQYMPEVRNRVLMLLSDRPSETLVSSSDKTKLAEEIQTALNKPLVPNLPSLQISGVVFTVFVLQ